MNVPELRKAINNLERAATDARISLREAAMLADCVADAVERGEDIGHALKNLQVCAFRVSEAYRIAQESTSAMVFEGEKLGRVKYVITRQMQRDVCDAMMLYRLAECLGKDGAIPDRLKGADSPWREWRCCRKGHKWRASVADHNRRGKCPFCSLW